MPKFARCRQYHCAQQAARLISPDFQVNRSQMPSWLQKGSPQLTKNSRIMPVSSEYKDRILSDFKFL